MITAAAPQTLFRLPIILLILALFTMRPSYLGEDYSILGLALALIAAFLVITYKNQAPAPIPKKYAVFIFIVFIYWGMLAVFSMLGGTPNNFALKSFILVTVFVLCGAVVLARTQAESFFAQSLVWVLAAMGFSYFITFLMTLLLGSGSLIEIGHIQISTYANGMIFFPFTITYGQIWVPELNDSIWRLGGGFREAGIAQAFYIWSIIYVLSTQLRHKYKLLFFLIVGMLGTLSTMALPLLAISLFLKYFLQATREFKMKHLFILILTIPLVGALFNAALYGRGFGIKDKMETVSAYDRQYAIDEGMRSLYDNPFGTGMYNNLSIIGENASINLIGALSQIGIQGLIGIILIYLYALFIGNDWRRKLPFILPFFMTGLLSQPLLDSPGIYLMLMLSMAGVLEPTKIQKA